MDLYTLSRLISHEGTLCLLGFLVVFGLMAFWEWKSSRRRQKNPKNIRWPNNLAVGLLGALLVRLLFPGAALWAAYKANSLSWGLFHWVEVPFLFSVVFTLIVLDWVLYYQHRAFHALPWLWKLHRAHHSDLEVDASTGIRFHPLEMALSMCTKSAAIVALGSPPEAVFLFELVLNADSLFNHGNVLVPTPLDRVLRLLIVTPDMHRIHHSVLPREFGSNFGFVFSWWDRFFGTYRAQPEKGQDRMALGLEIFNEPKYLRGDRILLQPFMDKEGHAALGNLIREG